MFFAFLILLYYYYFLSNDKYLSPLVKGFVSSYQVTLLDENFFFHLIDLKQLL